MKRFGNHSLRFLIIVLGLAFILVNYSHFVTPFFQPLQTWTYPSGYDPHGGYVDRLIFIIYPVEDINEALLALQSGSAYSFDAQIPNQYVPDLQANPAISVSSELSTSYRQFTMRCDEFPTNLTGYRRALAYALDKYAAVDNARGGFAQPMDNPIPLAYEFWTYENQMSSHYYTEDIVSANATLDAAHLIDPVGDPNHPHPGWRFYDADMSGNWTVGDKRGDVFAPDGLKVSIWVSTGYDPAIQASFTLIAGMNKCGLQGQISENDFDSIVEIFPTPVIRIGCFSWNIPPPGDPTLLYDMFHVNGEDNAFFYRWNNTDYNTNCSLFMTAPTRLEARNWVWNCCRILIEEMPMIVCYNDKNTHAYRTDIWEGYIPQIGVNRMSGNPFTYQQIRLNSEAAGPFGCYPTEYVTILTEGLDYNNTLYSHSKYAQTIFNLIYSKLWQVDPLDPLTEKAPDLAYDWSLMPTTASGDIQEGMRYTFRLYDNITWHDGTPFTSEDVQYSLLNIHPRGVYTSENVASIYRVDTPDDYTVEIYSNQTGYVTFIKATSVQILPKHIWSQPEAENVTWIPETPAKLTGTGCYKWVTQVPGQFIILDRYPNWHFAVAQPPRTPCPVIDHPITWVYIFVILSTIVIIQVLILAYLLHRRTQRSKVK